MARISDMVVSAGQAASKFFTQPRYLTTTPLGTRPRPVAVQPADRSLAYSTQVDVGQSDRPLYTGYDAATALRDGFTASHYVYLCIQRLAEELSRPNWYLEKRSASKGKERQWEAVPNSDFEALMMRPNPFQSGTDMMERALQHFFLTGNLILLKVRSVMAGRRGLGGGGKVLELWNVQPDQIKPVPSRTCYLSHYEFTAPGMGPIAIEPDDLVHIMIANPRTPFWGMPPLQAMSRVIDTEVDALNWWRWSIRNRAAKDGFIKYKRFLTDDEYTKIKAQLYEQVVGPWNARLPMILTGDAEWTPSSNTAIEMDFVELRKMTREEICGCFGVPPMLVGIQDHSTYNNVAEGRLALWQDNLLGKTEKLQSGFDLQLLPDFVAPGQERNFRSAPDLSRIPALLAHLSEMAGPCTEFWNMGVTFNELNVRFGLGFRPLPPEVGDASWAPSGIQPLTGKLAEEAKEAAQQQAEQQQEQEQAAPTMDDLQTIADGGADDPFSQLDAGDEETPAPKKKPVIPAPKKPVAKSVYRE